MFYGKPLHTNMENIWAAPCEKVSSAICGQQRPRLVCAPTQSDQSRHCGLTETLDTTECMNGEQRPADTFSCFLEKKKN